MAEISDLPRLVRELPTSQLVRFIANGANAGPWLDSHGLLPPRGELPTLASLQRAQEAIEAAEDALFAELDRRVPRP